MSMLSIQGYMPEGKTNDIKLFRRHYLIYFDFPILGLSDTMATRESHKGEEPRPGSMEVAATPGSAPSPQSEAVTNELQELSLQPGPNLLPLQERKNGERAMHENAST